MNKILPLLVVALISNFDAFSQEVSVNKRSMSVPLLHQVDLREAAQEDDWKTRVINLEMPKPGGDSYRSFLLEQKEIQRQKYPLRNKRSGQQKSGGSDIVPPQIGKMFEGNSFMSSVPMDNSMAISNDGILISTINSSIWMWDINQDSLYFAFSFDIFLPFSLSGSKYDPKITYDPVMDRFIFVFLRGNTPNTSMIMVCISEPGNPFTQWNVYTLPGNPFNNNRWTDYPAISQNSEDFFITANLIVPGEPWQTGFDGSLIWQINKESGYSGQDSLDLTLWSDITYDDKLVRNLNPVDGAEFFDKDNMYLLSNRNFDLVNDTIFFLEITDVLSSGNAELTVDAIKSSDSYFLAPSARQADDHTFDTNDSRVLGAVLFNNSIQFVQNCLDTVSGVTGVYHGTVSNIDDTPEISGKIISYPSEDVDLGYPNISHIGNDITDEKTLISFVHSGPNDFAGTSCVMYDPLQDDYTERIVLKEGVDFVDVLTGTYERWGDYSGSQTTYNLAGNVWISGSFGTELQTNGTWIAELTNEGGFVDVAENEKNQMEILSFPNPAGEVISVELSVPHTTLAEIALFSATGQKIAVLFNDQIKEGRNLLTFDIAQLTSGQYFIRVLNEEGKMLTEKVIKK